MASLASSKLNGSMVGSFRLIFKAFSAAHLSALAAFLMVTATYPALSQGTHLWTQSRFEEFEKGTPEGVSIGSDGHLYEGPALHERLTTPSTFVWSVAADKDGTTFLGTGSPATVLRVDKSGKTFTLFETKDLSVHVVRLAPDGTLYAAALPSGKVYKLDAKATTKLEEQKAAVVFD